MWRIAPQQTAMNAGHRDANGAVRGEQHMDDLRAGRRIEHRGEGIDLDQRAIGDPKLCWPIHSPVDRDDEGARERAAQRDEPPANTWAVGRTRSQPYR